jgi:hypothetical protein
LDYNFYLLFSVLVSLFLRYLEKREHICHLIKIELIITKLICNLLKFKYYFKFLLVLYQNSSLIKIKKMFLINLIKNNKSIYKI